MKKIIKVPTVLAVSLLISGVCYTTNVDSNIAKASENNLSVGNQQQQKLNIKVVGSSMNGFYAGSGYSKMAPGGNELIFEMVNEKGKNYAINDLDYKLTIDGLEYPKGLIAGKCGEKDTLVFKSFYGNIVGKVKIEVWLKNDKSIKSIYGLTLAIENDFYRKFCELYNIEDSKNIVPEEMKKPNYTYDRLRAKYIVNLPDNPLSDEQKDKFIGWKIDDKIYKPNSTFELERDTNLFHVIPVVKEEATWVLNNTGWWYQESDGTYPANTWKKINETWYHFDANGYMQTGWLNLDGTWYYLNDDGSMAKDTWIGTYYVDGSGAWVVEGWQQNSYGWWYQRANGTYPNSEWEIINGIWYYFDANGYMLADTTTPDGYMVDSSGAML